MSWPESVASALALRGGAHFLKCALQVNPYEYLVRCGKQTPFNDESSYNAAIVQAAQDNNIEVLAVTDHYRVRDSVRLLHAIREAGLHAFLGFEARTKDGVHMLCYFDPDDDIDRLERIIGECGIHDDAEVSPVGKYDVMELLHASLSWRSVCVAAHVTNEGGLLRHLRGQPRINAWTDENLLAASIPGSIDDAPDNLRPILENKDAQHLRARSVAIVNAADVSGPEELSNPAASCWIKMSVISVEALRQAFLDPVSRIRLASDPQPEDHAELLAMTWHGGFLDGCSIRFNENLNALIGGRGTGKSSVIESIRYVLGLEPAGEDAQKVHEGIVRHVLQSGTKISLAVRSHVPSPRNYLIERTIPNPPVVRDSTGTVLQLRPADVLPRVEIYGQHEISELTKSPQRLTRLLDRFVDRDPAISSRKAELTQRLERSRTRIVSTRNEVNRTREQLAALPSLEETLRRFQEAGVEDRLKDQSLLVREERILLTASDRLSPFRDANAELKSALPIDKAFLSEKALDALPARDILARANAVLEEAEREIVRATRAIDRALTIADQNLHSIREEWDAHKQTVREAYEQILRELQRTKIDGEEFIRLRQQIEQLRPLADRLTALEHEERELLVDRRTLLAEWEDTKADEFQKLARAAKRVSRKLRDRVRVQVTFAGNRDPLLQLLRDHVDGRLSETLARLKDRNDISLIEFAEACRSGAETLSSNFGIPAAQAERLAQASPETCMAIEELDLPPTTRIELNVAPEDDSPIWKNLSDLSTGQKATAVLLLLLLESDAPLVVDQPEDDLDNRFITDAIVPRMREEKRRRQFLFATHNANVPVLADAELIVGLQAAGEPGQGRAAIPDEHMGSIDAEQIRELVEELLEGGKDAFEMRRLKYGF